MKKPSLNLSAVKGLFIDHVEKLVFFGIALAAFFLAFKAVNRETYDRKPEDFTNLARTAQTKLSDSKWTSELAEENNVSFDDPLKVASLSLEKISVDPYKTKPWDKPINDIGLKRDEPTYLAAFDLEAAPGIGAFAEIDPNAVRAAEEAAEEGDEEAEEGDKDNKPERRTPRDRRANDRRGGTNAPGAYGNSGYGDSGYGGGYGGVGLAADVKKQALRWIVVTGLVPYDNQQQVYANAFATAEYQDAARNNPKYAGFMVQRAEVSEDPEAELEWKNAGPFPAYREKTFLTIFQDHKWQPPAPDVVPPTVTDPSLTFPLGPLVGRHWGLEVLHSSLRSLVQPAQGMMTMGAPAASAETRSGKDDNAQEEKIFGDDSAAAMPNSAYGAGQYGAGGYGATGASGAYGASGYGADAGGKGGYGASGYGNAGYGGSGYGEGAYGGSGYGASGYGGGAYGSSGYGGSGYGGGGYGEGAYGGGGGYDSYGGMAMMGGPKGENVLVRFFDFDAVPGKLYRYRFQILLYNPNYKVEARYLVNPDLANETFGFSPWSEPSPVVSIPDDTYLLARGIDSSKRGDKALVTAVKFDPETGENSSSEQTLERGEVADFGTQKVLKHGTGVGPQAITEERVEFSTGEYLVDFRGREKRKKDPGAPAEMLVIGSNGHLTLLRELSDKSFVEQLTLADKMLKDEKERAAALEVDATGPGGPKGRGGPGRVSN